MKQKFRKLSFVHVASEMPSSMSHFDKDFDAIVEGTYSQIYGGRDICSYALWMIKDGKIVNRLSWYEENQLSELQEHKYSDPEEMIEAYNLRG